MRNVLVTGASGFVGSHVVQALRDFGIGVRCLVRRTSRLDFLRSCTPEFAWGDVQEPATLISALDGVDAVVHCAGLTKARSRNEFFRVNAEGSRNLYAACKTRSRHLERIIHVGSLAALGPAIDQEPTTEDSSPNPVSDYGESKLAGHRIAERFMSELPLSIIIPPAVYGPRDVDFLVYFKFVAHGIVPLIGRCPRYLSLIYAGDLGAAIVQALASERSAGRSYVVSDGRRHAWTDVAEAIGAAMNRKPRYVHLPAAAARILGMLGDLAMRLTGRAQLISSQKVRELLQISWACSSKRMEEELGFRAQHPLESGMKETLAWYRENHWL